MLKFLRSALTIPCLGWVNPIFRCLEPFILTFGDAFLALLFSISPLSRDPPRLLFPLSRGLISFVCSLRGRRLTNSSGRDLIDLGRDLQSATVEFYLLQQIHFLRRSRKMPTFTPTQKNKSRHDLVFSFLSRTYKVHWTPPPYEYSTFPFLLSEK